MGNFLDQSLQYQNVLQTILTEVMDDDILIYVWGCRPHLKFQYVDISAQNRPTREFHLRKVEAQSVIVLSKNMSNLKTEAEKFVAESADPKQDFYLLAHEWGHAHSRKKDITPSYARLESGNGLRADKAIVLVDERFAWRWAKNYIGSKGALDSAYFYEIKTAALRTYRNAPTID